MIRDSKKNHSLFYDQIGFEVNAPVKPTNSFNNRLYWNNRFIYFLNTPGHSDGSICISIDNILFCGDLMIQDEETVTKLPGGSKIKFSESLLFLKKIIEPTTIVYSGHFFEFPFNQYYKYNQI
jgi:glyoxylase-like metal-dependent hydrolase (beta-lactamase superfamily II)